MKDETQKPAVQTPERPTEHTAGRRAFLRTAAIAAAGTVAGTVATTAVHAQDAPKADATRALTLKDNVELQKIGGWQYIQNGDEKLVVARTDVNSFVACSAICTHKGCEVEYKHEAKQFVCPCHGARFDLDGNVAKGPAKKPLARHNVESAALLEIAIAPPIVK